MSKFYFIETWGCQMNEEDSEKLSGMLNNLGYVSSKKREDADIIIFNTCCVRENAELKVYGNLGELKKLKKMKKDLIVAVCGCMMQQSGVAQKLIKRYPFVDIIFGTYNAYKFPEYLNRCIQEEKSIIEIFDKEEKIVEGIPVDRLCSVKAFVTVMYGCNNFCTYCIVPYVRGRERSREARDIIDEIRRLAEDGVKEIMLLGQNVNSYGKTLDENISFARLLCMAAEVDGIERIRFMTSHPKDLSDELIYAIRDNEKICKYIHLPFQAGSTSVLERMNRRYTKEKYLEKIEKIKKEIPDIAITTDIIVGFPGETDEDFEDTLDIVRKVRFNGAFTFIYSKRTGTPAAAMEDQIDEKTVKTRFNRLLEILNPIVFEKSHAHVGKTYAVIAEDTSGSDERFLTGRTDDNSLVHFEAPRDYIGKTVNVKITGCKTFYLIGEITAII